MSAPGTLSKPRYDDEGEAEYITDHDRRMAIWIRQRDGAKALRLARGGRPRKYRLPTPTTPMSQIDANSVPLNMLLPCNRKALIKLAALKYGVTVEQVMSPYRGTPVVRARQEAMWLIYTHCRGVSLLDLGRLFDRDHTTALNAIRKVEARRSNTIFRVSPRIHTTPCEIGT